MARIDRDRHFFSWTFMGILAALLVILFVAALCWINADIEKLQSQDESLRLSTNALSLEYADLKLELERIGSDGYVENEARENYGYIREGEIVFAFSDPEALKGYTEEEYQIIMDEMRD